MMRTQRHCRCRLIVLLCLGAVLCGLGSASAQFTDYSVSTVLQYGALYAPDQYNPVVLQFRNKSSRDVRGEIRLPLGEDPTHLELRVPVMVPAKSRVKTTAFLHLNSPLESKPAEKAPPLSIVAWYDENHARIDRTQLLGGPMQPEAVADPSGVPTTGFLLSISGDDADETDATNLQQLSDLYLAARSCRYTIPIGTAGDAPRFWSGLSACRVVALRSINPDDLDVAQRQSLLQFVRGGGVLLIPAPRVQDRFPQSWLGPYLPVRLIGQRRMCQIQQPSGPMNLGDWRDCAEAVEGEGTVVLRDADYVHAAWRPLGLGRVVFTSFPAGALELTDPRTKPLWSELLAMGRLHTGLRGTAMQQDYGRLMEPMLGKPTAPWSTAAGAIAIYVAVVLVVQLLYRGARRPMAFAVSLGVAGLIAAGFVVAAAMKRDQQVLQSARLALLDVGQGGGRIEELRAFGGKHSPSMSLTAADVSTQLTPAYNHSDEVVVYQMPFAVPQAGVTPERVNRVWSAGSVLPADWSVTAIARFGPEGLTLRTQNKTPLSLDSAQLIWGQERFAVGEVRSDERTIAIGGANHRPAGDYTLSSGLTSQDQRHKGDILASLLRFSDSSMMSRPVDAPQLAIWVKDAPELIKPEDAVDQRGEQSLLRCPVLVEPARPGDLISVDEWFSRVVVLGQRGLPYDSSKDEWLRTNMPGEWIFAIAPAPQAGRLLPQKVKLNIDLSAPQHRVTLRRGQCVKTGRDDGNPAGAIVAQWSGSLGAQTAEFTCDSSDFDSQGRIWLMMQVENTTSSGGGGLQPYWRIQKFGATIQGTVQAPPAAEVPGVLR